MPTSVSITETDAAAPAAAVFARLSDLASFESWLPRSTSYRGTTAGGAGETVIVGTAYRDRTAAGDMTGRVVELEQDRLVTFEQRTGRGDLAIRMSYELTPTSTGVHVRRTGLITTSGRLWLLHPLVVAAIRRENRRTVARLRAAVESRVRRRRSPTGHARVRTKCWSARSTARLTWTGRS